jgi:hypothetical protein
VSHAIAQAAHRFDERGVEFAAETGDEYFDGVGIAIEILRVDVLGELGSRDNLAAAVHQIGEHAEFVAGQFHRGARQGNASGARVQRESTATKFSLREPAGAANQSSKTGEDLFDAEGLGNVVVGAAVDALNFFVPAPSRCQNQHGREDTGLPPAPQQCESVDFGQSEIEHYGIILLGVGKEVGLLSIGGAIDCITGSAQRSCQLAGQQYFVLDNQNAQLHSYSAIGMNGG